jgi:hypothetical protein
MQEKRNKMKKIRFFCLFGLFLGFSALAAFGQSKPISQLDSTTNVTNADVMPFVNSGQTKKISFGFLYNRISNRLGLVARTNNYNDLSNRPTFSLSSNSVPRWSTATGQFENSFITQTGTNPVVDRITIDSDLLVTRQINANSALIGSMTVNTLTTDVIDLNASGTIEANRFKIQGMPSSYANGIQGISESVTSPVPTVHDRIPTTLAVYNALSNPIISSSWVENGLSVSGGKIRLGGTLLTGNTDLIPVSGSVLRIRNIANTADSYSFSPTSFGIGAAGNAVNMAITGNLSVTGTTTLAGNTNVSTGTFRVQSISTANALMRNNSSGNAFQASAVIENGTNTTIGSNFTIVNSTGVVTAANLLATQTTTATAGGTTTLTVSSPQQQLLTGSSTQTVVLPVVTTMTNGQSFVITNVSSGVVTVQTSGANVIQALATNTRLIATCINTSSGTGTASWNWVYQSINAPLPGVNNALANGNILVGNASNIATPVAMSGEATIANTGAVTLNNGAVTGKVLTGLTPTNAAVTATDNLLQGIGKLQGQLNTVLVTTVADLGTWNYLFDKNYQISATQTGNFNAPNLTGAINGSTVILTHNAGTAPTFNSDLYRSFNYTYMVNSNNIICLTYLSSGIVLVSSGLTTTPTAPSALSYSGGFKLDPYASILQSDTYTASSLNTTNREWVTATTVGGANKTGTGVTATTYTVTGAEQFLAFDARNIVNGFQTTTTSTFKQVKGITQIGTAAGWQAESYPYFQANVNTLNDGLNGFTGAYREIVPTTTSQALWTVGNTGSATTRLEQGNTYLIGMRIKTSTTQEVRLSRGSGYANWTYSLKNNNARTNNVSVLGWVDNFGQGEILTTTQNIWFIVTIGAGEGNNVLGLQYNTNSTANRAYYQMLGVWLINP